MRFGQSDEIIEYLSFGRLSYQSILRNYVALSPYTVYTLSRNVYGVYMKKAPARTQTSDVILAAARSILDDIGVPAVSMRLVAEQVGITPMAIYRHYADRAALLNAVADAGFHDLATEVQSIQLRGGIVARLTQVSNVFLNTALRFPNLYELMFLVRREGARVYPRDFRAGRSPTFSPTVAMLEEAMRIGELRKDDPVEIAFELSALSHGLIVLYLGGRIAQSENQFRILHNRSFRRYLHGLRP